MSEAELLALSQVPVSELKDLPVEQLEELVRFWSTKYYEDTPVVPDWKFDRILAVIQELKPDSDVLKQPGWGYVVDKNRRILEIPDTHPGFKKVHFSELDPDWRIGKCAIAPKFDGIHVVFQLHRANDGKFHLEWAASRFGIDLTPKFLRILDLDGINRNSALREMMSEFVGEDGSITFHAEAIVDGFKFENPRNVVSGILMSKQVDDRESNVLIAPWKVVGVPIERSYKLLNSIAEFNGIPPNFRLYDEVDSEHLKEFYEDSRPAWIPADGVVIYDSPSTQEWPSLAVKFLEDRADTVIKEIHWGLTRTGKFAPVAEVEPAQLNGAWISRVTLYNARNMMASGLNKGAVVVLTRSGGVIPKIVEVLEPVDFDPEAEIKTLEERFKDECKSIFFDGVNLRCDRKFTEKDVVPRIVELFKPKGLGGGTLVKILDELAELCSRDSEVPPNELLSNLVRKILSEDSFESCLNEMRLTPNRRKLLNEFAAKVREWASDFQSKDLKSQYAAVIYMVGIPGVGRSKAAKLAEQVVNGGDMKSILGEDVAEVVARFMAAFSVL